MSYLIDLSNPTARLFRCGAKARHLSSLLVAGFSVPSAYGLTFEAMTDHIDHLGRLDELNQLIDEIDRTDARKTGPLAAHLRVMVETGNFNELLQADIRQVLENFEGHLLSVRSSSNLEDRSDRSFAGQHDSFLNVDGVAPLTEAIKQVWASAYSDRAVSYLRALDQSVRQVRMGVVLQQMVDRQESAGVCFTIHPVTGERDQLSVSATSGLGDAVVDGSISPDEILIDRETKVLKQYEVALEGAGRTLNAAQVSTLADAALAVETHFGGDPQDIEWAYGNALWLLQARPLVRGAAGGIEWKSPVPGATWRHNWRLGEWIPEAVTPLFASWVLPRLVASREEFGTSTLGWDDMSTFSMPQPWYTLVNGFFFTRQDFPFSNSPGSGTRPTAEERIADMGKRRDRLSRWHTRSLPDFLERFNDVTRQDLASLDSPALLRFVNDRLDEAGEFWSFIAPIGYGFEEMMFRPFYEKSLSEHAHVPHFSVLFSGFPSRMHDAQTALYEILERVRASEESLTAVSKAECNLAGLSSLPRWLQEAITDYDAEFGHQVISLDIFFPTLGESPEYTLRSLQMLLSAEGPDPRQKMIEVQATRDRSVEYVLSRLDGEPDKQRMMQAMISYYQANASVREDANFYLQIGWPLLRRAVKLLGARLADAGALANGEEVFFLEREELAGLVALLDEAEHLPDLHQDVASREQLWQTQRLLEPPETLSDGEIAQTPQATTVEEGILRGSGASSGTASGKVRVVISQQDAQAFEPGEVLVIRAASPLFTPLMLIAAALVVEIGGGASHSSLVARELGLPVVVRAGQATTILKTGQRVEVDGGTGTVRVLD